MTFPPPPAPCNEGCKKNDGEHEIAFGHDVHFTVTKTQVEGNRNGTCDCVGVPPYALKCEQIINCICKVKFKITFGAPGHWRLLPANALNKIEVELGVENCGDKQSAVYNILHFPNGDGQQQGAAPDGQWHGQVKVWVECKKCDGGC